MKNVPFGMGMPGRQYNAGDYSFGFNGTLADNEIKGNGNSLDFGARIYDGRLGQWLSTDPLYTKYQYLSPYAFTANSPLLFKDAEGKDIIIYYTDKIGNVQPVLYKIGEHYTGDNVFLREVYASLEYLQLTPSGYDLVKEMQDNKKEVNIVQSFSPDEGGQFQRRKKFYNTGPDKNIKNTILWNPFNGFIVYDDWFETPIGFQTPASGLGHELDHARKWFKNPLWYLSIGRLKTRGKNFAYEYQEEKRNIKKFETRFSQEINKFFGFIKETIRTNHWGSPYTTGSSTTTTPVLFDRPKNPEEVQTDKNRT